jgi:L-lysine 2,3-aminomutase
MRSAGVV